tara:strand:- start:78 stop:203 length:126 start_codon:yes stop_codon:yes gene_type:complete
MCLFISVRIINGTFWVLPRIHRNDIGVAPKKIYFHDKKIIN